MEENKTEKTVATEPAVSIAKVNKHKPYLLYGALVTAVLLIGVAFLFTRGYIVAATVNGSPISRLAIISELEKQGGKQALEAKINEKVVTAEFEKLGIAIDDNAVAEEIKKIEAQVSAQGGTLDEALTQQGMTMEILQDQIESQLKLEKALADKIAVTDEEITAFMKENEVVPPAGTDVEAVKAQITDKLKQDKLKTEAPAWIKKVTDKASIKYYVTY
jgi:parvulin-like peptidyl-prolyl isomerase